MTVSLITRTGIIDGLTMTVRTGSLAALWGLLLFAPAGWAQSDATDETVDTTDVEPEERPEPERPPKEPARPAKPEPSPEPAPAAPKVEPWPTLKRPSDADFAAAWERFRHAETAKDDKALATAREELLGLRRAADVSSLDGYGYLWARSALRRAQRNDGTGAVQTALGAAELAPSLPFAQLSLARAFFAADPADLRYLQPLKTGLLATWRSPWHRLALWADLAAAALLALAATATLVVVVLFLRRVRYALHDFHHLFPRAVLSWQSAAVALLLLSLPLAFRLGGVPTLLGLLFAVAFYLSVSERLVAALLIGAVGLLPLVAGLVVEGTSLVGTPAEDLLLLEQGGPGAELAAARVVERMRIDKATVTEVAVLGRFETRRGRFDDAVEHLKLAVARRSNDGRIVANLATAMLLRGDLENSVQLYEDAVRVSPQLAAAYYDLARLRMRRAAIAVPDQAPLETDKAQSAIATLRELEPGLVSRAQAPAADHASLIDSLISIPIPQRELLELAGSEEQGERVRAQLSPFVTGNVEPVLAPLYAWIGALLLFVLGFLGPKLGVAVACGKCGRPVCRRCDPSLPRQSANCLQCVNVFSRAGTAVPAAMRVRKQIEVSRYHTRTDRLAYVLGVCCSGAGHVFSGSPVRGALYVFLFAFLLSGALLRDGFLRLSLGDLPRTLVLGPIGLLFLIVYLSTLRGLFRRQSGYE